LVSSSFFYMVGILQEINVGVLWAVVRALTY
jgi:hypothetical protein